MLAGVGCGMPCLEFPILVLHLLSLDKDPSRVPVMVGVKRQGGEKVASKAKI